MENKSLESFDYHDSLIKDTVLNSLNRTDFEGVSGRVTFTSTGDRIAKTQIEQMQNGTYYTVGYYDYTTGELDWLETDQWPGGSYPADRTIIKDKFRVLSRYILYAMLPLSYLGIIFSIASLVFNICTAKYSIIYNSLPSLNSSMAVGCTLCLACVTLFGMDGEWVNPVSYSAICLARTWTLTIGFTLSYGAMFVKVLYSWRICRATKLSQSVPSKTISQLIIPVTEPYYILLSLLVIDIAILSAWQSLDPLKRSIKTFDAQLPTDPADGDIKYRPLLEHCSCDHMTKWIAVIYSYKGLLLLAGLFLAYETRNVKIRFINDLKFVAMAIYNILVLCVVSVPVTLIIPYQHNALYGFISVAIILSCYLSLSLIFIPKMIPIIRRRIDLDQHETQQVLIHQENEKRLDELKERNDTLKQQIAQKEKEIRELHLVLQKKFSSQISNDDRQTSDSAFSEEHTDRAQESPECRMADTELL
ncbi:GABA-B-R1 [Bugula neritina]|uniref:GABA-B-R1 n=1 Tax=Bugula neritina TaxID=10212 RepID=A0A7J7JBX8_BUGNE|nr:GABA-B-R1 [Bugula neritina]